LPRVITFLPVDELLTGRRYSDTTIPAHRISGNMTPPMSRSDRFATLLLCVGIVLAVAAVVVVILMALGIVTIEHTAVLGESKR
jgi:cell division septal protein FtsQ